MRRQRIALFASVTTLLAWSVACGSTAVDESDGWTSTYTADEPAPEEEQPEEQPEEEPEEEPDATDTGCDTGEVVEPIECEITTGASTAFFRPADSNGYSSASQVRAKLLGTYYGMNLDWISIRTHEFLNDATFGYDHPADGDLSVDLQLRAEPESTDEFRLQVGIASEHRSLEEMEPLMLTLVLDRSCSMMDREMDLIRELASQLDDTLRRDDRVNIVAWNDEAEVLLENQPMFMATGARSLSTFVEGLTASGGTGMEGGLEAAYEVAERNYRSDYLNRVVLVSDGMANIGETQVQAIGRMASDEFGGGVMTVSLLTGDYVHDGMMDQVADKGQGASLYLANEDDVRTLTGNLPTLLDLAARDVSVTVRLPEGLRMQENDDQQPDSVRSQDGPQHLGPNEELVLNRTIAADCPDLIGNDTPITVDVAWLDPKTRAEHSKTVSMTWGDLREKDSRFVSKARAIILFTEVVKLVKAGHDQSEAATRASGALTVAQSEWPDDTELDVLATQLEALRTAQ